MSFIHQAKINDVNYDVIGSCYYGTSSTAATTTAKVATITNASGFNLVPGATVAIKFTYANRATSPTLNVNSTGAKSIKYKDAATSSAYYWAANQIVTFVYDGEAWRRTPNVPTHITAFNNNVLDDSGDLILDCQGSPLNGINLISTTDDAGGVSYTASGIYSHLNNLSNIDMDNSQISEFNLSNCSLIDSSGDLVCELGVNDSNLATIDNYPIVTVSSTSKGSSIQPVYINSNAQAVTCNTYAGGTRVTLNGTSKASSTASFYAPTTAGTLDYVLKSNGSGEPTWVNGASLVAPKKITLVATAGQTSFNIPFEYDSLSSNLTVYFNGILMKETDNYTVDTTNNNVILAGFSAEAGDVVTIMGLLGAQSIDFGQELIDVINEINEVVEQAKQEIDDKVQTAFTQIDAKIDEIETFINELPDDTTKLMAKNTNNTMESGYKITMASNYTPSGNYDVATKLYVDNKTSGMATQTYVNNQISTATASIVTDVFATGSTSPDNGYSGTEATKRRKLLWIDTGNSDPGLKYYNGSSWVTVPVRWS